MSGIGHANPLTAYGLPALRHRRSAKWRQYPPDVLPVWVAEMDTPLAPPIAEALAAAVARGDTGYAAAGALPEAFAEFTARRFGWRPDPASVRLVPDVMTGIVEVLRHLTAPGGRVVVNTPAYPPYFHFIPKMGRQVVPSPLALTAEGYRLDLADLERRFAGGVDAFLLCSPHNPTGVVFTEEELLAVAELAERHGVRVVSDEIHGPLVYPGARFVPFAALDAAAAERSVTVTSASKAWNLAGLKAAVAVFGPGAGAELAAMDGEIGELSGLFGVIAGQAAFAEGEPWLDDLLAGLDANRRLLGDLLAEHLPEAGYQPPQATYLAWLDLRALGLGEDPAEWFLRRGGVALYSGPKFGPGGAGHARFNFATDPALLTEAVERMAAALRS
ncbi:MalY/PatB family protein [Sphaerisporangium sp. B11E5]|uniref:MalY/PatB family protein n=1 Tax=Sphaerisporangium sp. B11E5 TaxID=3153563 RepID=UPI00325F87ED